MYWENMKNRRAIYAEFEKRIIDLYEQKILTADLLDLIASHYYQVGIDSAGSQYVQAQDGKDLHQVCIALLDPTFPIVATGSSGDHEEYWEEELKRWQKIVEQHWGWQAYGAIFPIPSQQNNATSSAGNWLEVVYHIVPKRTSIAYPVQTNGKEEIDAQFLR